MSGERQSEAMQQLENAAVVAREVLALTADPGTGAEAAAGQLQEVAERLARAAEVVLDEDERRRSAAGDRA